MSASLARRLSYAGAACVGSLATLLLGAPVDSLFARYAELGGLPTGVLGAIAVACILAVPIVWLVRSDDSDGDHFAEP